MTDDPFTPRPGAIPVIWRGREAAMDAVENSIDGAYTRGWLASNLMVGATGLGKSALLNYAASRAAGLGWPVIKISVSRESQELSQFASQVGALVDQLRQDGGVIARAKSAARRVSVKPNIPYVTFELRAEQHSDARILHEAFRRLEAGTVELGVPAMVLIDEVHSLGKPAMDALLAAVLDEDTAFVLMAAGLSSAWDRFVDDMVTPANRMFEAVALPLLGADESIAVLTETAASGGRRWPPEWLTSAARACGGLPAELQTVGSAIWRSGPEASEDGVAAAVAQFNERREQNLRRLATRLPAPAIELLGAVLEDSYELGAADLSEVRWRLSNDDEFLGAIEQLERVGLLIIDPYQRATVLTDRVRLLPGGTLKQLPAIPTEQDTLTEGADRRGGPRWLVAERGALLEFPSRDLGTETRLVRSPVQADGSDRHPIGKRMSRTRRGSPCSYCSTQMPVTACRSAARLMSRSPANARKNSERSSPDQSP